MVATVRRVWPGSKRTTVIVEDHADHREKMLFVWMHERRGPWIASLCERAEASILNGGTGIKLPIVLTVKPPTDYGLEIEDAELMPETASEARS